MEQFSHDLTLALEETSRSGTRIGRWGMRRRTRSTGNLPCAPQPTEDSSSSPADPPINHHNIQTVDGQSILLSDSDDRHNLQLSLKLRQKPLIGNFESDSFNENFSPARPNTRRKRKFKRMAVEYETTPSTPSNVGTPGIFPVGGTVKKRVFKHGQENFKSNMFFCGKRKRSHRDRYYDHDKQHSSSVPRQRDVFLPKTSYLEYKNRSRNLKPCERIMPLNKSIVSKIEKISQDTKYKLGFEFVPLSETRTMNLQQQQQEQQHSQQTQPMVQSILPSNLIKTEEKNILRAQQQIEPNPRVTHKSGSFESTFNFHSAVRPEDQKLKDDHNIAGVCAGSVCSGGGTGGGGGSSCSSNSNRKSKSLRRQEIMQLQFDDPSFMDCGPNEFSSSSSLSSDSEEIETNESDREGDDELTDWPGNEAMVNFTSKNDFKKAKPKSKSGLPQIKSDDIGQDDDTLMSGDDGVSSLGTISGTPGSLSRYLSGPSGIENLQPPASIPKNLSSIVLANLTSTETIIDSKSLQNLDKQQKISSPIDITAKNLNEMSKQIESEMSGETSNHFYSSPNNSVSFEPREIRAGCRRIRNNERPGFSIISSANEDLARFLQDGRQTQLRLHDVQDTEKLSHLAKLYSLNLEIKDGCTILTKTSNTTQSVHVEQSRLNRKFLSDYKRRCYGEDDGTESNEMAS